MKIFSSLIFFWVLFSIRTSAQDAKITANDLTAIEGVQWVGTLTYLDYSSNKKTSIKSNLTVMRAPGESNVWIFDYRYPDEPKANSKDRVILSADGKIIDGEAVSELSKLKGGGIKLVTLKDGTDNNLTAVFRFTYEISKDSFSIRKEVRADGSVGYFERNTYSWTRAK